jgi:hypothetical protein
LFSLTLAIPENPMQNISSNDLPSAVNQPALVSAAINRVVDIAPAPLLPGEKQADYAEVAVRIVRAAKPRDAIEEFLVRDVVDLTWEILRLRRMKSGILKSSTGRGLRRILDEIGHPWDERDELSEAFAAGDVQARKNVDAILKKAGLTMDEVARRPWIAISTALNGSTACWRVPRRAGTMRCARSTVTGTRLAAACVDQSKRLRTRSSEMLRLVKLRQGQNLDQRKTTARQSGQRKSEQRAEDQGRKGSLGSKRVASRLKHSCLQGAFTLKSGRRDSPEACGP